MPWLYLPKGNGHVYGYLTDGLITGFLFFIVILFIILTFKKDKLSSLQIALSGIIGLLNVYIAYDKHIGIESDKTNFVSDNYFINLGFAGMNQGIGIYVMGLAGIGVFITALIMFITSNYSKSNSENIQKHRENKALILKALPIILPLLIGIFYFLQFNQPKLSDEEIKVTLKQDLESMGNALVAKDYVKFVDFYPNIMIQSSGGKDKLVELLQSTMNEINAKGTTVKSVAFLDQYDTKTKDKTIQSIITQKVVFKTAQGDKSETQKMLAISDNGGESWDFIATDGKTKEQLNKIYPSLNQNLEF